MFWLPSIRNANASKPVEKSHIFLFAIMFARPPRALGTISLAKYGGVSCSKLETLASCRVVFWRAIFLTVGMGGLSVLPGLVYRWGRKR